ncbi:hypothetical protein H0H93_003995 [Arthromyces matolae]|nr:hypothetical protein H0H93_003995 [Arthromyces matolae]
MRIFQLIPAIGGFVLAQILLVTTTPIPTTHSTLPISLDPNGPSVDADRHIESVDGAKLLINEAFLVTRDDTVPWDLARTGYLTLSDQVLEPALQDRTLWIGVPVSENADGVESLNSIFSLIRGLHEDKENKNRITSWISQQKRIITTHDPNFKIQSEQGKQLNQSCSVAYLVKAVEKHNKHFTILSSEGNRPYAAGPSAHAPPRQHSPLLPGVPISSESIGILQPLPEPVPQPTSAHIYWEHGSICLHEKILDLSGLKDSLWINVPPSNNPLGVKSLNDIFFMVRGLVLGDASRQKKVRSWIAAQKELITRRDPEFNIEGGRDRRYRKCTITELVDAVRQHNQKFQTEPPVHPPLENSYDAKIMKGLEPPRCEEPPALPQLQQLEVHDSPSAAASYPYLPLPKTVKHPGNDILIPHIPPIESSPAAPHPSQDS